VAAIEHFVARQAHRGGQAQPALDAAVVPNHRVARAQLEAVVVEDALHPAATHVAVGAVGEDRGVLDGNRSLVAEAVGDPALHLLARRLAGVQHHVERVMDVIRLAALAQAGFEFVAGPGSVVAHGVHTVRTRPSSQTSMRSAASAARSDDSSSRIGLVLLM
jgi:hypothetical protein